MVEAQIKNYIGNLIIFIVTTLILIGFLIRFIYDLYFNSISLDLFIGFLICNMVIVTGYLLQQITVKKSSISLNIIVGFCLALLFYFAVYHSYITSSIWVGIVFYPILISFFNNKALFLKWATIYLIVFFSFILYMNVMVNLEWFLMVKMTLYCLGSCCIGAAIIKTNNKINIYQKDLRLKRNQQHILNFLHTFVPVVERKTRINRNEIIIMSTLIKKVMDQFPNEKVNDFDIYLISLLHFVSKIKCPDYLFEKDEKLTKYEFQQIQEHCTFSNDVLGEFKEFNNINTAFLHHHEKVNGTGYPNHLNGIGIPILSQALGIVESYLAMITPRSYREVSLTSTLAISELRNENSFDTCVIEAFLSIIEKEGFNEGNVVTSTSNLNFMKNFSA